MCCQNLSVSELAFVRMTNGIIIIQFFNVPCVGRSNDEIAGALRSSVKAIRYLSEIELVVMFTAQNFCVVLFVSSVLI